jgi:PKD repeat protein
MVSHTYSAPGTYTAEVTATNSTSQATATTIVKVDSLITGLAAANDSPTLLGAPTKLTASITGGNNVTYEWDFGDENSGSGPVVSHQYAAPGTYTATVTATNAISQESAETTVQVIEASVKIYSPLLIKP